MKKLAATRDAYAQTLIELGRQNSQIVVMDADLATSTRTILFGKEFPDRFFDMGVAEQDLMGTAAGLATCGKIVFASTFAVFGAGRAWDQVKISIAYPRLNVKIVVTHGGITVGEDGVTHQANEDLTLMRVLPNMTVVVPADAFETSAVIRAAAAAHGPFYIRLSRSPTPLIYDKEPAFLAGKGFELRPGKDLTIIACGIMVDAALDAAAALEGKGISAAVVNMSSLKPIDQKLIVKMAMATGAIVTAEEHSVIGGLGGAVAEVLAENYPVPLERVGLRNQFAESGKPAELLVKYGMTSADIAIAAERVLTRKKA